MKPLIVLLFALAAEGIRLEVPAELERAEACPIKRAWNRVSRKPMIIGTIGVVDHRRGGTRKSKEMAAFDAPKLSVMKGSESYSFRAGTWNVRCRRGAEGTGFRAPDVRIEGAGRVTLQCLFDGPAQWRLEMKQGMHLLTGDLISGADAILIRPATAHAGRIAIPGGYVFSAGGRGVAALDIVDPVALRFAPAVKPADRELISATAAALLLYEP